MSGYLHIPKPCTADWDAMTPEARGRHCAVCDKVVHDFVGMDRTSVLEQVKATEERMCGRIPASMLLPPLEAVAAYQIPPTRVKLFVLAFVLAFGLEVWGVSKLEAQTLDPKVKTLQDPQKLKSALEQTNSNEVSLQGVVLDVYTREPVAYANVMAYVDGKLVTGTLSDTAGNFELRFPKIVLHGQSTYQLRLRYQGRERDDQDIPADVRKFVYLIDASFFVQGLTVSAMRSRMEWDRPILAGDVIHMDPVRYLSTRGIYSEPVVDRRGLYRPLDEWLMMHNSEIHHSGRW